MPLVSKGWSEPLAARAYEPYSPNTQGVYKFETPRSGYPPGPVYNALNPVRIERPDIARPAPPPAGPLAVFELLPLHPPEPPEPGEAPLPPVAMEPDGAVRGRDLYCQVMSWVAANPCTAAACVVAVWYSLSGRKR